MNKNQEKFHAFHEKFTNFVSAMNDVFDFVLKYAMIATVLIMIFAVVIAKLAINGYIS